MLCEIAGVHRSPISADLPHIGHALTRAPRPHVVFLTQPRDQARLLENDFVVRRRRRMAWLAWTTACLLAVVTMAGSVVYYYYFYYATKV